MASKGEVQDYLIEKGSAGLTWTAVANGSWLDWCLDPNVASVGLGINIREHTATFGGNGTYRVTFTTLLTAADGVRRILRYPAETVNRIVPIRNFELSQSDIVALLENVQGVKYTISRIEDPAGVIREAKEKWEAEKGFWSALQLVMAGFLLPGWGSNLVEEGRKEMGNGVIGLDAGAVEPEGVVRRCIERYGV